MLKYPISILLPVYNGEKYLKECIDSILNQTFKNFELLIINDGSTDSTEHIIQTYTDSRITYFKNKENIRLISTLNKGFELINSKYIARMDADDIAMPTRLEDQLTFMEKHSDYVLCGSFVETIGEGKQRIVKYEQEHEAIKFRLLFDTHFPHPTAFIRTSVLKKHQLFFKQEYIHAEDYAFWNELLDYGKVKILPLPLVKKRSHQEQVSVKYYNLQQNVTSQIRQKLLEKLGLNFKDRAFYLYENMLRGKVPSDADSIYILLQSILEIVNANQRKDIYDNLILDQFFLERFWQLCTQSTHLGVGIFKYFMTQKKANSFNVKKVDIFKFLVKCISKYRYTHPMFTPIV